MSDRAKRALGVTALVGAAALAVTTAATHATTSASAPTVPCDDVILNPESPTVGGYRMVLGVVAVPEPYLAQVVRTRNAKWRYWRKAGLVVRATDLPVTVSVPAAWRSRAAITWGNNTGIVSSLRITGCPSPPDVWNAYAGGFYLRASSACVPLVFRYAGQSATVRFGVGRRC